MFGRKVSVSDQQGERTLLLSSLVSHLLFLPNSVSELWHTQWQSRSVLHGNPIDLGYLHLLREGFMLKFLSPKPPNHSPPHQYPFFPFSPFSLFLSIKPFTYLNTTPDSDYSQTHSYSPALEMLAPRIPCVGYVKLKSLSRLNSLVV